MASVAAQTDQGRLHLQVASLCFLVLFLEGYDITSMSYAIPSLIDAWHVKPPQFTTALTAGSFGLLFGALSAGLLALLWQFRFAGFDEEFLTVRASRGWRPCEEVEDSLPDGRHAGLWRRPADSFFSAPLL
jgi:MFS family permease